MSKRMIIHTFLKIAMNIGNIVIIIKHLEINQISAFNNPKWVDIPLNKYTKTVRHLFIYFILFYFILTIV